MKVDLNHLEQLSKLKIDEQERDKFEKDFSKILDFVDEITKLDLPMEDKSRAVSIGELREDEEKVDGDFDALKNAPETKDGCYLSPLVVE